MSQFRNDSWREYVAVSSPVPLFLFHVVYVPSPLDGPDVELCEYGHKPQERMAAEQLARERGGYVKAEKRPAIED